MESDIAISVENVTKRFKLNSTTGRSLKHFIVDIFSKREKKTYTALDNVSFQVKKGETLGIIGHNGAGKSTLLSIITGTLTPTSGKVTTNGKISSLLELGTGFHPDLTGRENVFLYGSIMGIPRAKMEERYEEIVAFADIGEYINQPVRFYSSGMYVRLAFSAAVQIDPEILLIDEVLAVGDANFRKKCLAKMRSFREQGKTLLLISHDLNTVLDISDRVALLNHGHFTDFASPKEAVDAYHKPIAQSN